MPQFNAKKYIKEEGIKHRLRLIIIVIVLAIAIDVAYTKGRFDGNTGKKIAIAPSAEAKNQVSEAPMKWSPTKPTRCKRSIIPALRS